MLVMQIEGFSTQRAQRSRRGRGKGDAVAVVAARDFTLTLTLAFKGEGIIEKPWLGCAGVGFIRGLAV